jgi:hypothetical protein
VPALIPCLFLPALASGASPGTAVRLSCSAADQAAGQVVSYRLGDSDHPLRFVTDTDGVWLEVVESKQRTALSGTAITEAIDIPFPYRLGRHWARTSRVGELEVAHADPGDASGSIAVRMHCSESAQLLSRLAWLRRVGKAAAQLEKAVAQEKLPGLLDEIHMLADTAPDAASASSSATWPRRHCTSMTAARMRLSHSAMPSRAGSPWAIRTAPWLHAPDASRGST